MKRRNSSKIKLLVEERPADVCARVRSETVHPGFYNKLSSSPNLYAQPLKLFYFLILSQ